MYRITLLVIILLLLTTFISTAEDVTYRLHEPTINEYMDTLPSVLDSYWQVSRHTLTKNMYNPMVDIIPAEISHRYTWDELLALPYETISPAYNGLATQAPPCSYVVACDGYYKFTDVWQSAVVEAWIRENIALIPETESFQDEFMSLSITPINIDFDDTPEYQIYVESARGYTYYLADITPDLQNIHTAQIVYWHDWYIPFGSEDIDFRLAEDINNDGILDWAVFSSTYSDFESCGRLSVLNWVDNQFVDLLSYDGSLCEPEPIEFINLDDDAALEIQQRNFESNNWFCEWHNIKTFDWNGSQYILSGETQIFDETLGCAMYEAEPLMWENQWEEAINLYELGLQQGWSSYKGQTTDERYFNEITQYTKLRLALDYWLVGRNTEAQELFNELQAEEPLSEMMATLISALADADSNVVAQCTAAYNVFWEYQQSMFNYGLPSNIQVGYEDWVIQGSPPQPERAGCNVPLLIDNILSELIFQPAASPIQTLEDATIEVENHLEADLNLDGISDWLIWLTAKVPPVLLLSDGNETYHISRPDVRRPDDVVKVATIETLDSSSLWISDYVYLPLNDTINIVLGRYNIESYSCQGKDATFTGATGNLKLWQVQNNTLEIAVDMPLCEKREIDEIFQEAGTLNGWSTIATHEPNTWEKTFGEAIYTWDEEARNYVPPEPEIIIDEPYEPPVQSIFDASHTVIQHFRDKDYETALSLLDETIASLEPETPDWVVEGLHYYRALILEAMEHIDEAITEYVTLLETESAWGLLAALHTEPIE